MVKVGCTELQYQREREYYSRIVPVVQQIKKRHNVANKIQQQETEFFKHLSNSLRVDSLPQIAGLLKRLNERLGQNLTIDLFLLQCPVAFAASMGRDGLVSKGESREIIVIVSQHFLNNLKDVEQLSVLGHEVAHLIFGHMEVPGKIILTTETSLAGQPTLKSDTLKWMICREISCDVLGLVACDCDEEAFSSAMLKFFTGLSHQVLCVEGLLTQLQESSFRQLDDIHESPFDPVLSSHPLTPLRLKLAKLLVQSALIGKYGSAVSQEELLSLKKEFNQMIDTQVRRIYPDIVSGEGQAAEDEVGYDICLAVALADGKVTSDEMVAIAKIVGDSPYARTRLRQTRERLIRTRGTEIGAELVRSAVQKARGRRLSKFEIVRLLKKMLVVAATDRTLENSELDMVYSFAKEFGVTQQDIVILVHQMGLR